MKNQNRLKAIRWFMFWGAVLIAAANPQVMAMPGNNDAQAKEGEFDIVSENKTLTIPPIDAEAPGHYATASFGLG